MIEYSTRSISECLLYKCPNSLGLQHQARNISSIKNLKLASSLILVVNMASVQCHRPGNEVYLQQKCHKPAGGSNHSSSLGQNVSGMTSFLKGGGRRTHGQQPNATNVSTTEFYSQTVTYNTSDHQGLGGPKHHVGSTTNGHRVVSSFHGKTNTSGHYQDLGPPNHQGYQTGAYNASGNHGLVALNHYGHVGTATNVHGITSENHGLGASNHYGHVGSTTNVHGLTSGYQGLGVPNHHGHVGSTTNGHGVVSSFHGKTNTSGHHQDLGPPNHHGHQTGAYNASGNHGLLALNHYGHVGSTTNVHGLTSGHQGLGVPNHHGHVGSATNGHGVVSYHETTNSSGHLAFGAKNHYVDTTTTTHGNGAMSCHAVKIKKTWGDHRRKELESDGRNLFRKIKDGISRDSRCSDDSESDCSDHEGRQSRHGRKNKC